MALLQGALTVSGHSSDVIDWVFVRPSVRVGVDVYFRQLASYCRRTPLMKSCEQRAQSGFPFSQEGCNVGTGFVFNTLDE